MCAYFGVAVEFCVHGRILTRTFAQVLKGWRLLQEGGHKNLVFEDKHASYLYDVS